MKHSLLAIGVFLFVSIHVLASIASAQAPAVDREIAHLGGDLYRVRDGAHYTVFLVTTDGIILGDTLTILTAQWLQQELKTRFPDRPVRYVLYSHHHADRAQGTGLFNPTADLVGHREFHSALEKARSADPARYRFVGSVERVFDARQMITLGGRSVEIVHTGPFHAPDLSVLFFPDHRLVFAVDAPNISTPFSFASAKSGDVLHWLKTVAALDADTVMFADGTSATRMEVSSAAQYLDALRDGVIDGYEQGQSLVEIQSALQLQSHRAVLHHAARAQQIAEIYGSLLLMRFDVSVTGLANYTRANPAGYCASYAFCVAGGAVPAGTATAAVRIGRHVGIVAEMTLSEQWWSARSRPAYDEEVAFRQSRSALYFRYSPPRGGRFSYALLGGVSHTTGDARGMNRVQGVLVPAGGRHQVGAHASALGWSAGAELAEHVGRGISIVLPIRVTRVSGPVHEFWPGRLDVQGGVGLSVRLWRRVE